MMYTATYDPADDKLRLSAVSRLPADLYERIKAAGFHWAPKQEVFYAVWNPRAEDIAIELAGDIGDEDSTLVDRAEDRAERFEGYQENRQRDYESAHSAVAALADNIPLGQPILVGHHSERHARKDAERIENGMRRAVKMWGTAQYWKSRAAGAIRAAKYKELPDVRARRIKTIEADLRKLQRNKAEAERAIKIWGNLHEPDSLKKKDGTPTTFAERARYIAGNTHTAPYQVYSDLSSEPPKITPEEAQEQALTAARGMLASAERWIAHCSNRLEYERDMLADAGGIVADRVATEKGGACKCWASPRGGWSYIQKVNKVSVTVFDNWGNGGANFTRTIPFDKLAHIMTRAEVEAHRVAGELIEGTDKIRGVGFVLRGGTEIKGPAGEAVAVPAPKPDQTRADVQGMKATLAAGVQVVSAPQLFPTPPELAARMVGMLGVQRGDRILEPSAGTGRLIDALNVFPDVSVSAVELSCALANGLRARSRLPLDLHQADFIDWSDALGFDRIIMNPPFANAADVQHIQHALTMLKPGGRLVALCANGSRQRAALQHRAVHWEDLPPNTFASEGTGVNVSLLVIEKPPESPQDAPAPPEAIRRSHGNRDRATA